MDSERWTRIGRVYDLASTCPPAERERLLEEACGGDPELRREVESLLAASDEAGSFLSSADRRDQIAALESDDPLVTPGQRLGRYELLSEIGAGARGVVYLARDVGLDRRVALKVLPPALTEHPERSARFAAEARAASGLNHPNILTIHEIGSAGGVSFIATELVDGVTLRQRLDTGPLPLAEALEIVRQCAAALTAAHEAGVVHRDVKPENIMVRADGLVKVVDFGLARVSAGAGGPGMTQEGGVIGTPRYMSPEQARGTPVDGRSDVFSLAAVLYELIAGKPACAGDTTADIFAALLGPGSCPELTAPRHPELQRIIARALEKDRGVRYGTMRAFAGDLSALRGRLTAAGAGEVHVGTVRRGIGRFGWTRGAVIAAAVALVAFVALGGATLRSLLRQPAAPARIESLAVLPLLNVSTDPDQDYLVDGITDQLTADLARSTPLRVISRTSAMHFKGSSQPLPAIARTLNVDAVVEGSVRRAGGRIWITAQLLDAWRDRHLWARTYEGSDQELAELTAEVARDVGHALGGVAAAGAGAVGGVAAAGTGAVGARGAPGGLRALSARPARVESADRGGLSERARVLQSGRGCRSHVRPGLCRGRRRVSAARGVSHLAARGGVSQGESRGAHVDRARRHAGAALRHPGADQRQRVALDRRGSRIPARRGA